MRIAESHDRTVEDSGLSKPRLETVGREEDYEELPLLEDSLKTVQFGRKLGVVEKGKLMEYLRRIHDVFAWSFLDMPGINLKIACHRLNIDPSVKAVRQKKQPCSAQRANIVAKEVNYLL